MRSLITALVLAVPGIAVADEAAPPPQPASWRFMLSDLTVFRLNPLGLETRARVGMQKRLYASERPVAANNFGFFGAFPKLNPASAQLALGGELQPLSIFNLRASAEVQRYFGTFGYLQSFASPNANYSDAALDDREDAARAANAFHASIQPTLQLRFGPIAVRAMAQLDYWNLDLPSGDTVAYEATFDTLLPDQGWTLATDTDVLYLGRPRLVIGLRHSYVRPFYDSSDFVDAADRDAYDDDNAHHRLGLLAAYTFRDTGPSRFNKPTVLLIASWYMRHRFRAGEPDTLPAGTSAGDYTSRALPYLLVGFAFESDFLPVRN